MLAYFVVYVIMTLHILRKSSCIVYVSDETRLIECKLTVAVNFVMYFVVYFVQW